MPPEIRRITEAFLHNPQKVEVSKPATTGVNVTQLQVPSGREAHQKREVLRRLLRNAKDLKNAIIFCNRKRDVAIVHKSLQKHGFSVGALHGDMDQSARTAALDQFRKGELPLLVASDVAARGLDIPEVSHVFNFDVPHHSDDYVHRIGRTARAGRTGTAISIVCPADQKSMVAIEKLIGQGIPTIEGDYEVQESSRDDDARERRPRDAARRSSRGKPTRDRDAAPRERSAAPREHDAAPRERDAAPRERDTTRREARPRPAATAPPAEQAAAPRPAAASARKEQPRSEQPRNEQPRNEPRRPRRDDNEPADHSHLPAFLLRPVRAPAS
jgi:superfamily II DNA/RNA helicase